MKTPLPRRPPSGMSGMSPPSATLGSEPLLGKSLTQAPAMRGADPLTVQRESADEKPVKRDFGFSLERPSLTLPIGPLLGTANGTQVAGAYDPPGSFAAGAQYSFEQGPSASLQTGGYKFQGGYDFAGDEASLRLKGPDVGAGLHLNHTAPMRAPMGGHLQLGTFGLSGEYSPASGDKQDTGRLGLHLPYLSASRPLAARGLPSRAERSWDLFP